MQMILTPKSSSIKAFGYGLKDTKKDHRFRMYLSIVFHTGKEYHYLDVPLALYDKMEEADSVGKFYNEHIKGKFTHEYIGEWDGD